MYDELSFSKKVFNARTGIALKFNKKNTIKKIKAMKALVFNLR